MIEPSLWLRLYETAWYLAIASNWSKRYHVYLPVNALNFVYEDAEIPLPEHPDEEYTSSK